MIKLDITKDVDLALLWAAGRGQLDVVEYLFEQGANVHIYGAWALQWAAEYGHLAVVRCLVEQGADIHDEENLAIQLAASQGHKDVVEYLNMVYTEGNRRANHEKFSKQSRRIPLNSSYDGSIVVKPVGWN